MISTSIKLVLLEIVIQIVTHIWVSVGLCMRRSTVVSKIKQMDSKPMFCKSVTDGDPVVGHTEDAMKYQNGGTAAYNTRI